MGHGAARHCSALRSTEPYRVMTHHNKRVKLDILIVVGTNLEMTQCSGPGLILVTVMKIPTWQWWKQSPSGSSSCPVWPWKTSVPLTKWSGCYCIWATTVLGCVKFTCSIAHFVQRLWCDWVKCAQTSPPYRWYVAMKTTGKTITCGPTCGTAPLSKHFQLWLHSTCSGLWLWPH